MYYLWLPVALMMAVCLSLVADPARVQSREGQFSVTVETSKQATVGILDVPEALGGTLRTGLAVRGTGVHIGDGYIVTARHATERPDRGDMVLLKHITILTTDLVELPAALVGDSAFLDVVLYRLPEGKRTLLRTHATFRTDDPSPADEVYTVGYPLGWGPAIAFGRIGNPNTFLPTAETRLLQADLSVCSGNSGGGLFNAAGELIGIMHAVIRTEPQQPSTDHPCSRLAFAIPGPLVKRIADTVIQGGRPAFSRLGIQLTAVKVGDRWRATAADVSGPARQGGVQKGDLLLAIDGTEIRDGAQLKNYLTERTSPGQTVTLRVRRGERELDLPVALGGS